MSIKKLGTLIGLVAAVAGLLLAPAAYAELKWNMPVGVTDISREVYGLHMLIFYVCCGIGVVVFGAMFYSVFAHRRSRHPKPADFHESTTVEIFWTIIPFAILVIMAIPAAGTLIKMEDTRNPELSIKVTGYQWKWQYEYLDQDVSFFSSLAADSNRARQLNSGIDPNTVPNYLLDVDRPLVVPTGKKIRFLITANDVIHAWWVPDLAIKKDAIPGYVNEVWTRIDQPGIYRGQCAELCGRDHGFMPVVVQAVTPEDYDKWLAQQKSGVAPSAVVSEPAPVQVAAVAPAPAAAKPAALSKDELMKNGEKVYAVNCQACHQATGQGLPPTFPSLVGSKQIKGASSDHIKQVLTGKGAMTPFRHLSDADIAAVVTYERNSWGNNTGVVQPADVAAARK